jgi:SAM-dependent methyltransferase
MGVAPIFEGYAAESVRRAPATASHGSETSQSRLRAVSETVALGARADRAEAPRWYAAEDTHSCSARDASCLSRSTRVRSPRRPRPVRLAARRPEDLGWRIEPSSSSSSDRLLRLSRDWDDLADADALWAVLSAPERKGGRWSVDDFLASGEQEIAQQLDAARVEFGLPLRHERALDFGCGAGRLVDALAGRFASVVGVDVSATMIETARRLTAARTNVELVVNTKPTLDFEDGTFDLVYTNLVLQHVPSPRLIEGYVRELVRITAPGGIALLQAPAAIPAMYRLQPLRRTYDLLRRLGVPSRALILKTPLQPMRMTALPRARFEAAARAAGGTVLRATPDGAHGFRYAIAG